MREPDELLMRARQGNDEALRGVLDEYRDYLKLLAHLRIGRSLQAKVDESDVAQDTLLMACRDFDQFRGRSEVELMQWLRQILAHVMANLIRRYRGSQRDVDLERRLHSELDQSSRALARTLVADISSPSQKTLRRERAKLLADAIAQLPEDYRQVIILRHLKGMTLGQVALCLGRSANSVQKLWSRAVEQLHQALKGQIG